MINNLNIYLDNRQDIEVDNTILKNMEKAIKEVLVLEEESLNYEISISFVDNEEIKTLNNDFRGINSYTDVLSFPAMDDFFIDLENPILGDIIISVEKAKEQAKEYDHTFEREMVYLTVHSMLHLLGYDHMEEEDKRVMRGKEKKVMDLLDIQR